MSTLVIKSFPEDLHASLKESARNHRRSLTQEVIVLLEQLFPKKEKQEVSVQSLFAKRKLVPGFIEAQKAFSGGTDSSIMISDERDAR